MVHTLLHEKKALKVLNSGLFFFLIVFLVSPRYPKSVVNHHHKEHTPLAMPPGSKRELTFSKAKCKIARKEHNARVKQQLSAERRKMRMDRRREEDKNPKAREERLAKNIPNTLERMRVWDERIESAQAILKKQEEDDEDDDDEEKAWEEAQKGLGEKAQAEETESLFPTLSTGGDAPAPKVLITTSRYSHLHAPAEELTQIFPNSTYIPRGKKFSIKEICQFAAHPTTTNPDGSKRDPYTHLVVMNDHHKKPNALTIVVLPEGPTFHYSLTNYVPGKKIKGHGNATSHVPELILNNFVTPLGKTAAGLFQSMFPRVPEFQGRQVVTLHNQRDYIFFRRHRYVFRERKGREKPVGYGLDEPGSKKEESAVDRALEDVKVGLQELGPQFTLKLRRLERGIKEEVEWEWKGSMEKNRRQFQL